MTRRLTPGQAEELTEGQCLLCGTAAETYADLCDHCAGVFAATAARVAGDVIAARQVVQLIPGQLEPDDQ